jgi:hypothetical protein
MKRLSFTLIIVSQLLMSQVCIAFDHLTCKQFSLLPEKEKTLATRSLIGGFGAAVGLVESAVRSVKKSYTNQDVALGANLTQSGVEHFVTISPDDSGEKFSQQLGQLCLKEGYQGRPAASALLDILMGIGNK